MSKLGDKHWTKKQIEILRSGYTNNLPLNTITKRTRKTKGAIKTKASRLGIKRPIEQLPDGYKRCPHCNKVKKITKGFYSTHSWCKSCLKRERDSWGKENKEYLRAYAHIRMARNPEKMRATAARCSHKQRAIVKDGHDLTAEQWKQIIKKHNNICPWCRKPFTEDNPPERDCIVPVCKGGRLTVGNVQPLHKSCNGKKWTRIGNDH